MSLLQSLWSIKNLCQIVNNGNCYFKRNQIFFNQLIGLVGDQGSVPGRVIPKTLKMVLDTSLLDIQHSKVHIKGKMEQSGGRSSVPPKTLV